MTAGVRKTSQASHQMSVYLPLKKVQSPSRRARAPVQTISLARKNANSQIVTTKMTNSISSLMPRRFGAHFRG